MDDDDQTLGHEIRRILEPVRGETDEGGVRRRSSVLQVRRIAGLVAVVGIAVVAIVLPLRSLVDLGSTEEGTGANPGAASVLALSCDGDSTILANRVVQAQLEGVSISVANSSGKQLGLIIDGVAGENVPTGNSSFMYPISPGKAKIACTPGGFVDTESLGFETFDVLPPEGWISPDIECDQGHGVGFEGLPIPASTPEGLAEVVRARATGLPPGARVEQAGYAAGDSATVRAVSDGAVIASFGFKHSSAVGWELWDIAFCEGQQIGWNSG
jgi:hypothetical protein